jgi:hypothetical protein
MFPQDVVGFPSSGANDRDLALNPAVSFSARRASFVWAPLAMALGLVSFCGGAISSAQDEPPGQPSAAAAVVVERIEIGFAGFYKVAEWTPLRMTVTASAPVAARLVVEAPDSDDNPCSHSGALHSLPANTSSRIEGSFRTGRLQGELLIRLIDRDGHELWKERLRTSGEDNAPFRPAMRHDVPLWLTLTDLPDPGDSEAKTATSGPEPLAGRRPSRSYVPRVLRLGGLDDLPAKVEDLESVDVFVFPTARNADGKSPLDSLTPAVSDRLRDWVRLGGTLILTIGAEEAAWRSSSLAEWVPITVEGSVSLRQLTSLESFSGVNAPIRLPGILKGTRFGGLSQRNTLVREAGGVLIATVPCGFGRVTVAGLDLFTPPIASWPGLPSVLRKLAGVAPQVGQQQQARQTNQQLTHTGITDLATQLQTAVEDFPRVPRPSHWWVMGLLALYLVVIGPLDYYFCHRVLRRPELTWLTFALLVVVGTVTAAWGAERINAHGLQFNQLDLVDVDTTTGTLRGRSLVSIYSPENRRFAVKIARGDELSTPAESAPGSPGETRMTWSGVPENSVSGVYRTGGTSVGGRSYRFPEGSHKVDNFPILQWSVKSLSGDWTATARENLIESRLETGGAGQVAGSITHHLPGTLENCLLIVGGWAFAPTAENAAIAPDVPWQPGGPQGRARDLKALLTGERRTRLERDKLRTDVLTTTAPYNPLNHNRVDLIQMISFHQAVGESEYTGLRHGPLRQLEMTRLADLGRGILVGRLTKPLARATIDGTAGEPAEHETFVRLVVPIRQIDRAPTISIPKPGEQNSPILSPSSEPSQ